MEISVKFIFGSALLTSALMLCACTPKYDWREVGSDTASYRIALPARPTTLTRRIDLNHLPVSMTMTAAEIDGVTFAVGTAELSSAMQAQVSLAAMKAALVNNMGGAIRQEKTLTIAQGRDPASGKVAVTEIVAAAPVAAAGGVPRILFARLLAKGPHVYQLAVLGPEKALSRDLVDTFFSSFRLN